MTPLPKSHLLDVPAGLFLASGLIISTTLQGGRSTSREKTVTAVVNASYALK